MYMKKVLFVEDDPFLIDIYGTKLKQAGYEIAVQSDGEKVVASILKEKPDVVVLDIVLPHVDGWDILRSIQENEEAKRTKIIILSNLGQKDEVEKGLQLGAARYLIKAHYTPSQVVGEITKVLEQYYTRHE